MTTTNSNRKEVNPMELPPIEWNDSIDTLDEEGMNDYLLEQQAVKKIEEDLNYNFI